MLIAIPCEKIQRETLGSRKPTVTGLTSQDDRSDRSGPTASLFEQTGLTGLGDRSDRSGPTASLFELTGLTGLGDWSDRSDSDRAMASF